MFKQITISILIMFMFVSFGYAEMLTLPNGQKINIDSLTDVEISNAIKIARKSLASAENAKSVVGMVKGIDPSDLEGWAKLITGTIKTICNDLSITVNDFVKTPVGLGIAALIFYRVAGEGLLENALDVIIMVPLWFLITGIILFLGWYFFSCKTIHDITYTEQGKKIKQNARRVERFDWGIETTNDDITKKGGLGISLIGLEILITFIALCIVLG